MKFTLNPFKMFAMPSPDDVRKRREEDNARHEARQESPNEIRSRQLSEAERQYLLHIAAAEDHQSQADMYKKRVERLRPQTSGQNVTTFHPHTAAR